MNFLFYFLQITLIFIVYNLATKTQIDNIGMI